MANLITVTTFSSLSGAVNGQKEATTASAVVINVDKIVSIATRATAFQTTGITNLLYEYPVNQSKVQVQLICTETRAALLALANAPLA